MDLSSFCRGCMKEEVTKEENNFNQDTVKMFTFCTNIQIQPEEHLPLQFCNRCTNTIQSCYTFINTARDVDSRLKYMIGAAESSVKPADLGNSFFHDIKHEDIENKGLAVPIKIEPFLKLLADREGHGKKRRKHPEVPEQAANPTSNETGDISGQTDWSLTDQFKTYICTACSKGFLRKKNYENHMFSYHSIEAGSSLLTTDIKSIDDAKFLAKSDDFCHLSYACPHCPEKFETSKDRQHHKREKHRGQLYECSHCPRRFAQRQLLTAHIRKHTRTKQQFTCHYCSKIFKVKSRLKLHLHMHDDTLKPHLCDICGSRYSHRQAMLNHQLVHTGQKPFTCELCGYTCRQASNIRRHKRAHLNERKHQCVQCGKGFNELSSLKKHMYCHTDERPYKCPHCDNCYKNSDKRKKHLIRVHGMDPSEIPRLAKDGGPARRYVTDDTTPRQQCYSLLADRVKRVQTGNNDTQPMGNT